MAVDADFTGRVVDIVHEGFDLAIRVGELADSRLAARRLGDLDYGLYASPAYLRRRAAPNPGDLAGHALLAFTGGSRAPGWRLTRDGEQIKGRRRRHAAAREQQLRGARGRGRGPRHRAAVAATRRCARGDFGRPRASAAGLGPAAGAGARSVREQPLPERQGARLHRPGDAAARGLARCNRLDGIAFTAAGSPHRRRVPDASAGSQRHSRAVPANAPRRCNERQGGLACSAQVPPAQMAGGGDRTGHASPP